MSDSKSTEEQTLVILDDALDVVAAYKCSNRSVLTSFLTLVQFLGFDKYYLIPKGLNK